MIGLVRDQNPVFRALAEPVRRRLLDRLRERNAQTLSELTVTLGISRQAVRKHLSVLEGAELVFPRREGRERLHYLNTVPLYEVAERWIRQYERPRLEALRDLKQRLEEDNRQ